MNIFAFITTTALLIYIIIQQKKIMTKQEQFDASIARLEGATTEIANDLKKLRDENAEGKISDESLAKLDTHITALEEMGKDPENPVPEPE